MVLGDAKDLRFTEAIVNRIMIVDDEADTAEFLKVLLERNHYEAIVAKDGGQAHGMFVIKKPDFVILDLILPGETGFEVCERLKKAESTIPVLILTAIELEDSMDLAKRVGADAYMTKPFDPDALLAAIKETAQQVWLKHRSEDKKGRTDEAGDGGDHRVRFSCRCGKRFKVSETHRGKTLTCPQCGEPVVVPRRG